MHCTSARLHIECIYAVVYDEQRHQLREAIGMGEVLPFSRQYFCRFVAVLLQNLETDVEHQLIQDNWLLAAANQVLSC